MTGVIKDLITEHLTGFITGIISVVGAIIVLFYLDWPLTLVMFSIIPISLLFLIPVGKRMTEISKGMQTEAASFSANITNFLSEARLEKASNAEENEFKKGQIGIKKLYALGIKEGTIHAILSPIISSFIIIILVLITL